MDLNVVDLAEERAKRLSNEPDYWACDCGCITFYMRASGDVQCAACKAVQLGLGSGEGHKA